MKCRICDNRENNKTYETREMMFGYRDKFIYFECPRCECLQISEIPSDMAKYYPPDYGSFPRVSARRSINPIRKFLRKSRDTYAVFGRGVVGKLICGKFPRKILRPYNLSRLHLRRDSSILDIGCGSGLLLYTLKEIGFKNVMGIDPYIDRDIEYENGLKILKATIHSVRREWDLIMFHHSFEHIPDQLATLGVVSRSLSRDGVCLIRIPTTSSYAWRHYGVNWVQLDAPRHFYLHSVESVKILANKSNLELKEIVYDSSDFQFWGSEQYARDIPMLSARSYFKNPSNSIFSKEEIKAFEENAKVLNMENRGDQAAFYLVKRTPPA